ncbi:hypothetical protein [Amycolatopsis pretoriensis]|uniref:hypothetical protein n=1 Tax=Amycolatopsis pretoriensis TaxID=218821 RepID=UPI001ABF3FDD|nr:hypothetical protein [Amycolatopsis pretoriensis]
MRPRASDRPTNSRSRPSTSASTATWSAGRSATGPVSSWIRLSCPPASAIAATAAMSAGSTHAAATCGNCARTVSPARSTARSAGVM